MHGRSGTPSGTTMPLNAASDNNRAMAQTIDLGTGPNNAQSRGNKIQGASNIMMR